MCSPACQWPSPYVDISHRLTHGRGDPRSAVTFPATEHWPVRVFHPDEGRRLSWPEWSVSDLNNLTINRARHRETSLMCMQRFTTIQDKPPLTAVDRTALIVTVAVQK